MMHISGDFLGWAIHAVHVLKLQVKSMSLPANIVILVSTDPGHQ